MYRGIRFSWMADARVAVTRARGRGTTGTSMMYYRCIIYTRVNRIVPDLKCTSAVTFPLASAPDVLIASVQNVMLNQKGFKHHRCQNQKG
eukprot:SAG11_NODE_7820_length_1092_cov_1.689829_1_plen_89_part_10